MDTCLKQYCQDIPKIELHAHLAGSCSNSTIQKLQKLNNQDNCTDEKVQDMSKVFKRFSLLHQLCNNLESIALVTKDVIEEFAHENVKYLELRTTPRNNADTDMTKESYVETVIATALQTCRDLLTNEGIVIVVKILLSIDRSKSVEDAEDTVNLVLRYSLADDPVVVGLDFSGNPYTQNYEDFLPILNSAKDRGVKISMHIAEINDRLKEAVSLYSVRPDRLGHATYLHTQSAYSQKLIDDIIAHKTPMEFCITSNLVTDTVDHISNHQLKYWRNISHPFCICTDDKGVFNTSLSNEYYIAAKELGLSKEELWLVSSKAIDYIFASDLIKTSLKSMWLCERNKLNL